METQLSMQIDEPRAEILRFEFIKQHPFFMELNPEIVTKFWEFHQANLHVFDLLLRFSRELLDRGRKSYGIKAIIERVRWHYAVETTDSEFKLNNNHAPCYARLIVLVDPRFRDFFELRSSPGTVHLDNEEHFAGHC